MAEGEIVSFGAAGHGEERDDVGAWSGWGRGDGEVCADDGDECGEGNQRVEMPVTCAAVGGGVENAEEVHSARPRMQPIIKASAGSAGRL